MNRNNAKLEICKAQSEIIIYQMFRRILFGQILICVIDNLVGIINGIIVGNLLDEKSMLIIGLTTPLTLLQSAVATCISAGTCILYGRGIGRANKKYADGSFSASIILSCLLGLILSFFYLFFSEKIAVALGATKESIALTTGYIRFLSIGLIPYIMIPSLSVFLQMSNDSYFSIFSTSALAGFTILFDIIAIRVFKTDVIGIALAGSIAKYVILVMIIGRMAIKKRISFRIKLINFKIIRSILVLGIPSFVPIVFAMRDTYINHAAYSVGGNEFVSGLAVFNTFGDILCSLFTGIIATFTMLFNIYYGVGDFESLKILIRRTVKTGLLFILGACTVLAVLSNAIVAAYGVSGKIAEYAVLGLYSYILFIPLNFFRKLLYKSYEATGHTKSASAIIVLQGFIIPFLFISIVNSKTGIYISYALSEGLIILLIFFLYIIKNKRTPASLLELICIDKSNNTEHNINFSINNGQEIGKYSEMVQSFCKQYGVNDSDSYHCALCLEEIVGNTFACNKESLNTGRRVLSVDVYLAVVDDRIKLRICDNGVLNDPCEKIGMYDSDNPLKNIGIRLVAATAKDMCYQSTFGINVISIVI